MPWRCFSIRASAKRLADLVILENVGLHVDVVARPLDGREHRPIGIGAVLEQPNTIAGQQGTVGHRLFEREVAVENVGLFGAALEPLQDRAAARRRERPLRALDLRRFGGGRHIRHDPGERAAGSQGQQAQQHETIVKSPGIGHAHHDDPSHRAGRYATAHREPRARLPHRRRTWCGNEQTRPPGRVVSYTSIAHDLAGSSPRDG